MAFIPLIYTVTIHPFNTAFYKSDNIGDIVNPERNRELCNTISFEFFHLAVTKLIIFRISHDEQVYIS